MDKTLYLLVGAALTWAFYFIQRRVERRRTVDAIERNQKLLTLKQGLEGANTSLDELRRFETQLIGKAETAVRIADGYVTQAEEVVQAVADTRTPDDMNQQARAQFERLDTRLDGLVAHLRRQLDGAGLVAFETAHRAWLAFRENYAHFIADSYSSGSIRPLIHAVTMESITASWIAELETQLGDDNTE